MLNASMANMITLAINSYTTAQVEPHQIGICNVTKFTLASLLLKFAMFEFATCLLSTALTKPSLTQKDMKEREKLYMCMKS